MCDCTRRDLFRAGFGFATVAALNRYGFLFGQDGARKGKAKACIVLWMDGGPSHLDTFDPKPGTANGGEFKAIEAAPGMMISEHLPRLAKQGRRLSIVRSLVTQEEDHFRGRYILHTGYKPGGSIDHPALGSAFAFELGEGPDDPGYVWLKAGQGIIGVDSIGPAFLGPEYAPFVIEDPTNPLRTILMAETAEDRIRLAEELDRDFNRSHEGENLNRRRAQQKKVQKLKETKLARALDVSGEPEDARALYGDTPFGRACLLARRLVQHDVRFVEVELGGWDTHGDNFSQVKGLSGTLDAGFGGLLEDLARLRMLDSTLVLWMGEFGRTPKINGGNGRDHWPKGFSVVFAGGGVGGGRVVGSTGKDGMDVSDPASIADVLATVCAAHGIDPAKKFFTPQTGVVKITENGRPIASLLQ
jgi:uncharacterized protein (DUF1501 family)